jgi:arylsulfatase A-like enzyme
MKAISVAIVVFLAAMLCASPLSAAQAQGRTPNVIIIVADDLGWADVGVHQQSKDVKTPNIDSIAALGVRFSNGYVSGPVCSPTRAALLTGRYQQRFGFEQNPRGPQEENQFGLPLDEVTLPQQLKKAGYVTGMVGKWHLGHLEGMRPPQRGFDEFFGFLGGAHRYVNMEQPDKDTNALRRGDEPVGEKEYLTDAFTREAVSFIERHKDKPFFLYLPYNAPHSPMQAPEKYLSRFRQVQDEKRRAFLAMLSAMDDGIGQVLAKLRDVKLEEDTLVIFFSDNGGPTYGNSSLNTPFRATKGSTFEGGVRVPFMMRWKGRLPEGKVEDRMIVQFDLFPTILALAGAEPPAGKEIDGRDLMPYLAGGKEGAVHEALFWRFGPRRGMRAGDFKLQWNLPASPALYNLADDAGETRDLAEKQSQTVQKLMTQYRAWDAQMTKPRWPGRLEGDGGAPAAEAATTAPAPRRRAKR